MFEHDLHIGTRTAHNRPAQLKTTFNLAAVQATREKTRTNPSAAPEALQHLLLLLLAHPRPALAALALADEGPAGNSSRAWGTRLMAGQAVRHPR